VSDSTKNWILKEVLPLVVVVGGSVGGSVLWITNELADLRMDLSAELADVRTDLSAELANVRTDLSAELANVRERVASVEGKLDLLISGLDIRVKVADVSDRPGQPTSSW